MAVLYLEADRIEECTNADLEQITKQGFCAGSEQYSRHLSGAHGASS